MSPDRKATIGDTKVEEFYWNGKMVVYINDRKSELTFEEAKQSAEKEVIK